MMNSHLISAFLKKVSFSLLNKRSLFSHGNRSKLLMNKLLPPSVPINHKLRFTTKMTNFPIYFWPNFLEQRTMFLERFLINDYEDPTFNYSEFILLSLMLVESVSGHISIRDFKSLRNVVTPDVIEDVKDGVKNLSQEELAQFWVPSRDVVFSFPHSVLSVEFDNGSRILEIVMVYHSVKGSYRALHYPDHPQEIKKLQILNYRFRRLLGVGDDSKWIITGLNHIIF